MSRVPLPAGSIGSRPYRPEPTPADYSDDVCDDNFAALKALVQADADDEEFELVEGPAW